MSVLASCSSAPVGPTTVPRPEVLPLAGKFKVNRFRFSNGLRLLVVEDHSSPTFAYQTWFQVGSRNEVAGKTGLAHFFEHMMFRGTKNHPPGEFDRMLEGAGVQGENAFTGRDYTGYIQELPSTQLSMIAPLEADRMINLIINEKGFKTEREVVQNERRMRTENNPDGIMEQELFELAFKSHPYHWPIIGYEKDLASMTPSEAEAFYKSHYAPNRATIVIAGDVTPEAAYREVEKNYAKIPASDLQDRAMVLEEDQSSPRSKELKLNIQIEKMLIGYRVPAFLSNDIPALIALQNILTGGKSARLQKALVDKGIATTADSYDLSDGDPSIMIFEINLQKGKSASQAEAVFLKEMTRIASQPPSHEELSRVKNRARFEFSQALSSNIQKAYFLGHFETLGQANSPLPRSERPGFEVALNLRNQIQSVTPQEVSAVAKKYLNPKSRTVITGVPK